MSRFAAPSLLVGLAFAAPVAAQRAGRLYDLVVLDDAFHTRAADVNSKGQVTGVRHEAGVTRAFVGSRDGGEKLLEPLAGFPSSSGYVLNEAGFVAGISFSPASP